MRVLFDTNVVLDVLLDRAPYGETATELMAKVERQAMVGLLCGTTVTTVHYIARKTLGEAGTRTQLEKLLGLFEVAPVTRSVLAGALTAGIPDFEDAVLHEAARLAGSDGIVTRNVADFAAASVRVYTPDELISVVRALREETNPSEGTSSAP